MFCMGYRIVTDATSDIDEELLQGLPPLTIIPMDVIIGDTSYVHGPGGNLTLDDFYRMQREGKFASTSQITPDHFMQHFRSVLDEGDDLLYCGLPSGLSGTYECALLAKQTLEEEYPERTILCVDSLCASAGLGFLILEALKKQAAGCTLSELATWIEEMRLKVCHWFTVDTFDHLKHGGRVSAAAATIGTVLHIKPLLRVNHTGALDVIGKPRGTKQAIATQLQHMEDTWAPDISPFVLVAHGDNAEGAQILREKIKERFPDADLSTTTIGPVIGSHTGPGMLAILFWGTHR